MPQASDERRRMMYYRDSVITEVRAIPGESQLETDGVVVYPNGRARARVEIPVELTGIPLIAHAPSRLARFGLHTARDPEAPLFGPKYYLDIILFNWSRHYALKVYRADKIALAADRRIRKLPLIANVPLRAGFVYLHVRTSGLPQRDDGLRFLDPPAISDMREVIGTLPYAELVIKPQDFFVFEVIERPAIPENHIAVIETSTSGLLHSSSNMVYHGSHGVLALEIKSFRSDTIKIRPMDPLAKLLLYESPLPLPHYRGLLGRSASITSFLQE